MLKQASSGGAVLFSFSRVRAVLVMSASSVDTHIDGILPDSCNSEYCTVDTSTLAVAWNQNPQHPQKTINDAIRMLMTCRLRFGVRFAIPFSRRTLMQALMYTNTDVITVASTDRRTPPDELNTDTSKHATPGNASCGTAERPRKSERATNKDEDKSEQGQKQKDQKLRSTPHEDG